MNHKLKYHNARPDPANKTMFAIEDYEIVIFPAPDKDEHWLYVRFPDIPEILTGGGTIEERVGLTRCLLMGDLHIAL